MKLVEFLQSAAPYTSRESKELISHDTKSNSFTYKYTFFIEIPKVCKDDLIILPTKLCSGFGGVNQLGVCYKVGSNLCIYDPVTLQRYEISGKQYFNYENDIGVIAFKGHETEFYITSIEQEDKTKNKGQSFMDSEIGFARVDAKRQSDGKDFSAKTHLGKILRHGDAVIGYDLTSLNSNEELSGLVHQRYLPDAVFIRKHYGDRPRIWKLKRMEIEENEDEIARGRRKNAKEDNEQELKAFMDDIE